MSWIAGLNFASGQFSFEQRLNASSVNDGDAALIVLMFLVLASRSNVAGWTSAITSISPRVSARSTASLLPYLIHCSWSNFGLGPRNSGFGSIRMIRLRLNSVTTYGPLPTIGICGL